MKSVICPKVKVVQSKISDFGMIADDDISQDELVYIKGGHILTRDEFYASKIINSYLPISDNYVIGAKTIEEEEEIKLYNNHSCSPNCGMRGDIVFVAINNIKKGEELVVDYAFIDNEDYRFRCNCGSADCRKIITGFDWQIESVQKKYNKKYFSAYVQSLISSRIQYRVFDRLTTEIIALRKKVFCLELGFAESDEFDGEERQYTHCCIFKDSQLIAYARVGKYGDVFRISRVTVEQSHRKFGFGRQIIFWAETEVLKFNADRVIVHALLKAEQFYIRLGYAVKGDPFYEDGEKHYLMEKSLSI